jgi:type IV pilus assembly protein PilB
MSITDEKAKLTPEQEKEIARRIAEKYNLEYIELDNFEIDPELFRSVPADLMLKYNFIPIKFKDGILKIAICDASNVLIRDELELLLGSTIDLYIATPSAIQEILKKSESSQRVLEEATETFKLQVLKEEENIDEVISIDKITSDASPMIKLVDSIIFNAIQRRASDIHIETRDKDVSVKYRIDGVLQYAMEPLDKRYSTAIISRIKVMSELDIAEKRIPQDGRFKLRVKNRAIDFRVSIMPSIHGEDAVIRILDKETLSESFAELKLDVLGFNATLIKKIRKYINAPYGMFLVTGPTGSGKTTTLYAALNEIKSVEHKIITIEDPVEYQLEGITQVPVNEKKGLTFARGLRSILRHDPDKIMVGEIRDPETALIAIQSALTGHLVFTTVHANNVLDVLGRFLNMGVEPYNFVNSLLSVLAQRLVRVICSSCKRQVKYEDSYLEESGLDPKKYRDFPFYEGAGCIECAGTGFRGRTAIAELLELNDRIRDALISYKNSADIRKIAKEEGMVFLREAALEKVFDGTTTLREANKVTFVEENL